MHRHASHPASPHTRLAIAALVAICGGAGALSASAQCTTPAWSPVAVEDTFMGTNVRCFAEWNGDLYIGGEFLAMNGAVNHSLVKFDGTTFNTVGGGVADEPWGPPPLPGRIFCMVVGDPDGAGPLPTMLIIGGQFTHGGNTLVNGVASPNVVGWDGANWVNLGGFGELANVDDGESAQVRDLAFFDSGSGPQLYACGEFKLFDGRKHIARFNGEGWESFGITATLGGIGSFLTQLHVHNDGTGNKLYATGIIEGANGLATQPNIARWNGTSWESVGNNLDVTHGFFSMATFDPDGAGPSPALLCVGGTSKVGDANIFFHTWNGSTWTNQALPIEQDEMAQLYGGITDLAVHNDGTGSALYLGMGNAYVIEPGAALHAYGVKKWNGTSFSNEAGTRIDYAPDAYTPAGDTGLLSTSVSGSPRLWLGKVSDQNNQQRGQALVKSGASWGPSLASSGSPGTANDGVMWDADGAGPVAAQLYCAGDFPWGAAATFDGQAFHPLPALPGTGLACAVHNDGSGEALYVSTTRNITNILAGTPTTVYKLTGATWTAVGGPDAFYKNNSGISNSRVYDLVSFNSSLYAVGRFGTVAGVTCNNIARLAGGTWQPVGPVATPGVYANNPLGEPYTEIVSAVAYDDGSGNALYVNGRFQNAGGAPANFIARWNGTAWSPVGTTLPDYIAQVNSMYLHDDGVTKTLYAGGFSVGYALTGNSRIHKWDGTSWTDASDGLFGGLDSEVDLVGSFDAGNGRKLYAAGYSLSGSYYATQYYELNGTTWSAVPNSFFVSFTNGKPMIPFTSPTRSGLLVGAGWAFGGTAAPGLAANAIAGSRSGMAVWACESVTPACPGDFNNSGSVTADDIFAFLDAWFAQNGQTGSGLSADVNGSDTVTADDIFAYLDLWFVNNGNTCP